MKRRTGLEKAIAAGDWFRAHALFFAELASVERIEDLSEERRRELARRFVAACERENVDVNRFARADDGLRQLHRKTREVIDPLLAGESLPALKAEVSVSADASGRIAREFSFRLGDSLLVDLMRILAVEDRLPFVRCPTCKVVSLRTGRRRYCSAKCMARGVEESRKAPKRAYMKGYMAKRRRLAKLVRQIVAERPRVPRTPAEWKDVLESLKQRSTRRRGLPPTWESVRVLYGKAATEG